MCDTKQEIRNMRTREKRNKNLKQDPWIGKTKDGTGK